MEQKYDYNRKHYPPPDSVIPRRLLISNAKDAQTIGRDGYLSYAVVKSKIIELLTLKRKELPRNDSATRERIKRAVTEVHSADMTREFEDMTLELAERFGYVQLKRARIPDVEARTLYHMLMTKVDVLDPADCKEINRFYQSTASHILGWEYERKAKEREERKQAKEHKREGTETDTAKRKEDTTVS